MGPTFYRRDAVGFTLNRWFDIVLRLRPKAGKPGRAIGYLRGAASGFTSTLAHAGRPPLLVYLLPQRMDKTLFVGTTVMFFAVVNYVKLVPFYLLGQLSLNNLGLSLLFAPLAPLGVWLGLRLERWIPEKPFYRISYAILFATGCKLIYDVFGPLSFAEMTNNQQSSALTPIPSPAAAGEGSIVTEMVVNHFRKTQ